MQANLDFGGHTAVFYRVYQRDRVNQTALVALNKGASPTEVQVERWLSTGEWRDAESGEVQAVTGREASIRLDVPAHGVRVLLFDAENNNEELAMELSRQQKGARRSRPDQE